MALAQVGGAQHADEVDDFLAIGILVVLIYITNNTIKRKVAGG